MADHRVLLEKSKTEKSKTKNKSKTSLCFSNSLGETSLKRVMTDLAVTKLFSDEIFSWNRRSDDSFAMKFIFIGFVLGFMCVRCREIRAKMLQYLEAKSRLVD